MTIQEAIQYMATAGSEPYCKICTVDRVDEQVRAIDCTPIDESAPLVGVNLQANQDNDEGLVAIPAVGSYVVVSFLNPSAGVVTLCDKVDKTLLKIGQTEVEIEDGKAALTIGQTSLKISAEGVVLNGGQWGGLVKIAELTAKLNAFVTAYNSHTHLIPIGGVQVAGSPSSQTNPAPISIPTTPTQATALAVTDYEDTKVKH